MTNPSVPNYDPAAQTYTEVLEPRLIVRVSVIGTAQSEVGYWDSLQGGQISRTVTPRKQPGKGVVAKIPGIHRSYSQVTLSRAWNENVEHRKPIHDLIKGWINNPLEIGKLRLGITQMLLRENGTYLDYDYYEGPLVSYEGPKGNSEGEGVVKEQVVIDPDLYQLLESATQQTPAPQR